MEKKVFLYAFLIVSVLCGNVYAQAPYRDSETSKLRDFLLQESAEPGVKNYQQLGISQMDDVNWGSVPGLYWHPQKFLLREVYWHQKKLAGDLDLSGFEILKNVYCGVNELNSLNVTGSESIVNMDCPENNLRTLDLTTNVNLEQICFKYNNVTEIDLSNNKKLTYLVCTGNQLEILDLSGLDQLSTCYCVQNHITDLNLQNCKQLRDLWCMYNNLTSLDLSNKRYLRNMSCTKNNISDLRIVNCDFLNSVDCSDNNLQSVDFSGCTDLAIITCINNNIEKLNIEDCVALEELYCYNNKLNTLKLPESPLLNTVHCKNNYFDFYTLPKISSESVSYIYYPQYSRIIEADINHVDFSTYYEIEGFVSRYTWNDYLTLIKPEMVEDGIFSFDESLKNKQLICRIENQSFPKLVLRYDVTVRNDDVANDLAEKKVTSVYASDGYVHIDASSAGEARLYSLHGALLMTKNIEEGLTNIPVKQGLYVVTINKGKGYKLVVR